MCRGLLPCGGDIHLQLPCTVIYSCVAHVQGGWEFQKGNIHCHSHVSHARWQEATNVFVTHVPLISKLVIIKNHKIQSGMVQAGPRVYCQLPTPNKFESSYPSLSPEIKIFTVAIIKNHKIGSDMVQVGPRAYCQLPTTHKFGSSCPMLLTEIKICMSATMKNYKIGSGMIQAGPRAYCQLLSPPPTSLGQAAQQSHIHYYMSHLSEILNSLIFCFCTCSRTLFVYLLQEFVFVPVLGMCLFVYLF